MENEAIKKDKAKKQINILLTGDFILDQILIPNEQFTHKDVLTINNNDVLYYNRYTGVDLIYNIIMSFQGPIPYFMNLYKYKLPHFTTYSKWQEHERDEEVLYEPILRKEISDDVMLKKTLPNKDKTVNIKAKSYFRREFIGSNHECKTWDELKEQYSYKIISSDNSIDSVEKIKVLSIYDRFTSVLKKGTPQENMRKNFRGIRYDDLKYKDIINKSDYIILRAKYYAINEREEVYDPAVDLEVDSPLKLIISKNKSSDTILITSLRELRDLGAYIPIGISWDDVIYNIDTVINEKKEFERIKKIRYLIIDLSSDGYIIIEQNNNERKYTLICQPDGIDGYRNNSPDNKVVSSYLSYMQAYLTYKLSQTNVMKDLYDNLIEWCKTVCTAMLYLDIIGFEKTDDNTTIEIPFNKIMEIISEFRNNVNTKYNPTPDKDWDKYSKIMRIYKDIYRFPRTTKINTDFSIFKTTLINCKNHLKSINNYNDKQIVESWSKYIIKYGFDNFEENILYSIDNNILKNVRNDEFNNEIFIPYVKFNEVVSIDKDEINSLRAIERNIRDYKNNPEIDKPLSIGVFGEPGSGKSFTIKKIVQYLYEGNNNKEKPVIYEFNLSQMKESDELVDALRLVQNSALQNNIPVVFWDEFDTMYNGEQLGWLKFFLAPMQDGKFLYNQTEYYIGRCIFIFAGGTCETNQKFVDVCREKGMKKIKAPDFLGRLKNTYNVPSLNKSKDRLCHDTEDLIHEMALVSTREMLKNRIDNYILQNQNDDLICLFSNYICMLNKIDDPLYNSIIANGIYGKIRELEKTAEKSICNKTVPNSNDTDTDLDELTDYSYIMRRGMILRQNLVKILNKKPNDEIRIDDNLLNAFIKIEKYYYDARSILSILNCCHIEHKQFKITASEIPTLEQLNLHVNGREFIDFCKGNDPYKTKS